MIAMTLCHNGPNEVDQFPESSGSALQNQVKRLQNDPQPSKDNYHTAEEQEEY